MMANAEMLVMNAWGKNEDDIVNVSLICYCGQEKTVSGFLCIQCTLLEVFL